MAWAAGCCWRRRRRSAPLLWGFGNPPFPPEKNSIWSVNRRFQKALVDAMRQLEPNNPAAVVAPEGALPARFQLPAEAPAIPLISGGFRWVRGQQRSSLLLYEPPARFLFPWLTSTVWCRSGNGFRPFLPG